MVYDGHRSGDQGIQERKEPLGRSRPVLKLNSKKGEKKRLETKADSPAQVHLDSKSHVEANGQEPHHSAELGIISSASSQSVPEKQFRHNTRNPASVSSLQRNRKARLAIPPPSDREWDTINDELGDLLDRELPIEMAKNLPAQESIKMLDDLTYGYLFNRFGAVENKASRKPRPREPHMGMKLLHIAKRTVGKAYKKLKEQCLEWTSDGIKLHKQWANITRKMIKLRARLKKAEQAKARRDAERRFRASPPNYAKRLFAHERKSGDPDFSKETANAYFTKTYQDAKRNTDFSALDDMPRPPKPTVAFKLAAPSWPDFKAIVRKKRNGAAAGLNGISYVPYKKCDRLLRRFYDIVKRIHTTAEVPDDWGIAYMVLIPKEEDRTNPELFRNIAVTNTNSKIYFSVISRNLEEYMVKNQYIDRSIQKGFLQGMSGCVEHTFSLHQLLKDAFQHHRQIIAIWIDLANAYGSIMHNLIQFAMEWYHVPASDS